MRNPLKEKSFAFALKIVQICKNLNETKREYILSKQLLRSGTSIGAMYREAEFAESNKDFIHKLSIAQKECNESMYWIELLFQAKYLSQTEYTNIYNNAEELIRIITSIIKTSKAKL